MDRKDKIEKDSSIYHPSPIGFIYVLCGDMLGDIYHGNRQLVRNHKCLEPPAGAGSNLIDTSESASAAVSINITDTSGNWGLVVKRDSSNWHSNLHLYIKRTSDGSAPGSISGGTSYQEVTDIDQSFFSGNGDRSQCECPV